MKPTETIELLTSLIDIKCFKCAITFKDGDKCPKCGGKSGGVIFKSNDCTLCKYFNTTPLSYPTGRCEKHELISGIKNYCIDFESKTTDTQ